MICFKNVEVGEKNVKDNLKLWPKSADTRFSVHNFDR